MNPFRTFSGIPGPVPAIVLSCASLVAVGCTAQVQPASATVVADEEVTVEAAPVDVYTYPHTEYRGTTVYYVNGRWYRPRGNRWSYYRTEPAELVRHRRYVQEAPPARRSQARPGNEAERVR